VKDLVERPHSSKYLNEKMNPIHKSEQELTSRKGSKTSRKDVLRQIEIPWRKKEHRFDPTFFKCEGKKIVKYEPKDLKVWGVSYFSTIDYSSNVVPSGVDVFLSHDSFGL
jgi:hypothetical protein